jgi:hypothetical protein
MSDSLLTQSDIRECAVVSGLSAGKPQPQDCLYCDQHFPSKKSLFLHVNSCHSNIEAFYCTSCKLYFKSKEEKWVHFKEQHSEKHKCILCSKAFSMTTHLRSHLQKNHVNQFFECKYNMTCCKFFKTKEERKSHILNVHESRPDLIKCIYCKKMFTPRFLTKHIKCGHKSIAIKCEYAKTCHVYFHSEEDRKKHYMNVHESDEKVKTKCPVCSKFMVSKSIYYHMRFIHNIHLSKEGKLNSPLCIFQKCPYCDAKIQSLGHHVSKQHKNVAIKCNFRCETYFLNEEERRQHILQAHSTTNVKSKIKCFYCGIMVSNYAQHIGKRHTKIAIRCKYRLCVTYFHSADERKKHYDEKHLMMEKLKRFSCSKCNYRSISALNLNQHEKRNHEGANLKCVHCQKTFISGISFKAHIKKVHNNRKQCRSCKVFVSDLREHALSANCGERI